jgi:hypothetical protein
MLTVQVRKLRQSFRELQAKSDIKLLLSEIQELQDATGERQLSSRPEQRTNQLKREDLHLICFDLLTSG